MDMAVCPECSQVFSVEEPSEGQQVTCPRCGAHLEVLGLEPLELDWLYIEPYPLGVMEEIEV